MLLESTLNDTVRAKIYSVFRMQISLFESGVTCTHKCKNRHLGLIFLTFLKMLLQLDAEKGQGMKVV